MKSSLVDLNNHLFAQLERLNDEDLKGEQLKDEIERSKAMTAVAGKVVENAALALEAHKLRLDHENLQDLPKMLESK